MYACGNILKSQGVGLVQKGTMQFNITSLNITNNYGMALAQIGFLEFIFLDPPKFQVK